MLNIMVAGITVDDTVEYFSDKYQQWQCLNVIVSYYTFINNIIDITTNMYDMLEP